MDDSNVSATYGKLFPEQVTDKCSADALESNTGPLAYLHTLYRQALNLESRGDAGSQIKLDVRRPDIGERLLDQATLDKQIPALTLVIEAMTRQARRQVGEKKKLDQEIALAQYPVQLPFHYPLEQIKAALRYKKTSLFNVLQHASRSYPNFTYGNLRNVEMMKVMLTATGFSPALQSLLLDASDTAGDGFLQKSYGVTGNATDALRQLTRVEFFCQKTGLKPEAVLDMLATSGVPDDGKEALTTVKQAKAYAPTANTDQVPIAGHVYGAVFINNATAPSLSLEDTQSGPGISLRFKGASADHFSRIHKIIHLQHALQLPFADVDLLVMSALRAEGQTQDFHITKNTLRALGVFSHLCNEYDVTAEQFAALINGITPYAVDETLPFLDRVLDGPGPGQLAGVGDALLLDGGEFDIGPGLKNDGLSTPQSSIGGICRAFALDEGLAYAYLSQVTQALELQKPALSIPVFSSLYRLTRLPRLLRLGMKEGASLIALLAKTDPDAFKQLAGTPKIIDAGAFSEKATPDILDVLIGVSNLESWLRQQKISAQVLLGCLTPLPTDISVELKALYSVDARLKQTIADALPRIRASLLTETQIAEQIGLNMLPDSGTWLSILSGFLDARGLVRSIRLSPPNSLMDKLSDALKGRLKSDNALKLVDISEVAGKLEELIQNATVAQEDVTRHLISTAFSGGNAGFALTPAHALPLLRWINKTPFNVLTDVLAAADADMLPTDANASLKALTMELWYEISRHALTINYLRLSAAGLTALLDHPAWFDRSFNDKGNDASTTERSPALTLDLCYQISSYRRWVERCQQHGFDEADTLDYFLKYPTSDQPGAADVAARRLSKLIGWNERETLLTMPAVRTVTTPKTTQNNNAPKTFDDFLKTLNSSELGYYNYAEKTTTLTGLGLLMYKHLRDGKPYPNANPIYEEFKKFLADNPGPLKVSKAQYLPETRPGTWKSITYNASVFPLEIYTSDAQTGTLEYEAISCAPNAISDIDFALRIQSLCETTGLSVQSLSTLSKLDEHSPYGHFQTSAQLVLGVCSDEALDIIEPDSQERWRDALAAYLLGYWVPSNTALQSFTSTVDDLSSYFLTDVRVSSSVKTTTAIQTVASLQQYLHRLFSRLDPGYAKAIIPKEVSSAWRQYVSEYGSWKIWQTQLNQPENLIYYANRPNKSTAFQSLEVELNQGKLDPDLLQTAITSYLTKFEQTSNLQVISGYLDGVDPKNDTYHFIGKTNASPAEYYWRSVDMGLRDDKERLSPLAWTEWDKVNIAAGGQIVQSVYTDPIDNCRYTCDAIRPVIIEGRPYVFWVERGTVGLPSADAKNQTPTKFKRICVQYIYKQSDGFWSPPNELICLDGTRDGQRLPDKDNPYLKDDTYQPGLIALVNREGERAKDPWLTIMLYNCAYVAATHPYKENLEEPTDYGSLRTDYFVEARDLLLIDKKQFESDEQTKKFSKIAFNSYKDVRKIQHPYSGDAVDIVAKTSVFGKRRFDPEFYGRPEKDTRPGMAINKMPTRRLTEMPKEIDETELSAPANGNLALAFSQSMSESTITVTSGPEKTVTVTAHYFKIITKRSSTPTLTLTRINKTFNAAGTHYTITHEQRDLSINSGASLSIRIVGDAMSPISVGYSVTIGDQRISQPAEQAYRIDNSGQWTCSLKIKQLEHLLEDSFRILVYIKGERVASVPLDITVNPNACVPIALRLYVKGPKEQSFSRLTEEDVVADGKAVITQVYSWTDAGQYTFALCEAGNPRQNVLTTFDIRQLGLDEKWDISIKRNDQQAQYLDLNAVAQQPPTFPSNAIRLNTLFGKKLVSRAARSVERALEWEAQLIEEPTIDPNITTPPVDFHGANGAYFRELFLHLPDLVATRLSEQQQFDEAERWYTQYLFDPYRTQTDEKHRPPLWNTRPLAEGGSGSSELQQVVDPTARAFTLSRYYRQALFLSLLDNWQRQGDHFYRQLTPGSINHAWLCYQKALKLIGPLPERTSVSRWVPLPLDSVSDRSFRAPINERVTVARRTLEHRIFNLRHGLAIDGKMLPDMNWHTEGTESFGIGQRGIGHLVSSYNSDRAQIPAYRFRHLIVMARAAVRQLKEMGHHYMKLMEDESNTTFSVLLKQQEIRISDFTLKLKYEAINSFKAKKDTLQLSRLAAVSRKDFYAGLIQAGRSPMEEAATGLIWSSAVLKSMSIPFQIAAGITEAVVPTIYGMAFGGNKPNAPTAKTALALEIAGEANKFISDQLLVESGYERRADEWQFERKQAELDVQSIDLQLKEANIELNAATVSLKEAQAERANLEEAHVAMTTGFTIIPIYNWLVARQELLYGPAYDAVLSLCLTAEAAWRYEIGDYSSPAFIKTSAWADSYRGMLAGESLLVDLLTMENAYVQSDERRLGIRKTIDVRGTQTDAQWLAIIKSLTTTPISFELNSADFDKNYPGHYLRQLKHVSVSFVMTSDADTRLENVSAILTQTDSTTLVEPTGDGAAYLYKSGTKTPASIKRNLRAQQQIALSSGTADDGLGLGKADWAYELLFHDGRYLPFEGTGAISRWQLSFPDADFVNRLLAADGKTTLVKTIQIHLAYTAVDGGKEFTDKVKTLRDKA